MAIDISKDRLSPKWLRDLLRLLPIRPQFVLSGNVGDRFLLQDDSGVYKIRDLHECLWAMLSPLGYTFLVRYDPIDGISLYPSGGEAMERLAMPLGIKLTGEAGARKMPVNLDNLSSVLRKIALREDGNKLRVAVVIDYASRISASPQQLSDEAHNFFRSCEKLANESVPLFVQDKNLFNPIIWLTGRAQELPSWYGLGNSRIHYADVSKPDNDQRLKAATVLLPKFADSKSTDAAHLEGYAKVFADLTDGFTIRNMFDVATLAKAQDLALADIDDAVRSFKTGDQTLDSPWRSGGLKAKIRAAEDKIRQRVLGQSGAIEQTLDILKRSVMGLTGAQAKSGHGKPRGVLFFAGPTGVGKTELAKALSESIFGDEKAYIRFDMSEFSAEHSDARLLGAPPGYVGYEGGGELTNAVRLRPFSVILFDEIEKANGKILDKFLQILEDGRLTDGRGETVYFSESVIVFTSNLGIVKQGEDGRPAMTVNPGDSYETVKKTVLEEIKQHFTFKLSRPEILNRLGDNIVVFNFIEKELAVRIFEMMLGHIQTRIKDEHKATLHLSDAARRLLLDWCTGDLANGGRGIGNRMESALINPLARALFELEEIGSKRVEVVRAIKGDNGFSLELKVT